MPKACSTHPKKQPTDGEKKIMLAQVVRVAMLAVLQNHTYQFNKEARVQSDGGPIGAGRSNGQGGDVVVGP